MQKIKRILISLKYRLYFLDFFMPMFGGKVGIFEKKGS